jgi:hypothetical protein
MSSDSVPSRSISSDSSASDLSASNVPTPDSTGSKASKSASSDAATVDRNFGAGSDRAALEQLQKVRPLLLELHKTLMEAARLAYEANYGPILSKGDYFRLVVSNEWFQWLRPFSQFIVRIDERIAAKKPNEVENAEVIVSDAQKLLSPSSQGAEPDHPYYQLMQQNPEIAMLHAQLIGLLERGKASQSL